MDCIICRETFSSLQIITIKCEKHARKVKQIKIINNNQKIDFSVKNKKCIKKYHNHHQ